MDFIKRVMTIGVASIFIIGSSMPCDAKNSSKSNEKPNLIFIAIDDMNNWVGSWGGQAKTPNIDRLASMGVKFTNAYCVVPACNPSRTALMTGQRPETTHQFGNEGNFRTREGGADRVTLPQYLRSFGYEAVAAGKLFHQPRGIGETPNVMSDPISWNDQYVGLVGTQGHEIYLDNDGFGAWEQGEIEKMLKDTKSNSGLAYMGKAGIWGPIDTPKEETGDWKVSKFCADYLLKDHDKPFFLACGIFRPHSPQLAPKEFFDLYPLDSIQLPEVPDDDMDDIPKIAQANFSTPFVKVLREKGEWKRAVQGYLACMSYADACVGNVLEALEKSKYRDNTIVVFWTDHGWQLGHKWRWEKFTLWKQATNSPMIIYKSGMKSSGKECKSAVTFLDIFPTVVDMMGIPKPSFIEGQSMTPLLKNPNAKWDKPAVVTFPQGSYAVNFKQWNYILYSDGSQELYDHTNDPNEFHNLAIKPGYEKKIQELRKWIPKDKVPDVIEDSSKNSD